MTAATDRAGGPCGPAGRLALDRLAASATAERRSVVAEDRRKRPRTLDAGSAHARPGSCLTMTSSRRPHRRGDDPVPNDRTRPSQQNASRSGNPRQFGVGTPKRRGRRTGVESRGGASPVGGSVAHPVLSQPGRRPIPVGTFPLPALRTRRADFRHRALQWNHAIRTRAPGRDQRTGLASGGTRLAPLHWPAGASSRLLTP